MSVRKKGWVSHKNINRDSHLSNHCYVIFIQIRLQKQTQYVNPATITMRIRQSRISDARSISCIYVQTWQDTYLGVLPFDYLIRMSIPRHEQAFRRELRSRKIVSFVAEDRHEMVGFITGGSERYGSHIYAGEIYTLYVVKGCQRQGIGTQLISALATQFYHNGVYSFLVQVLKENPYRHFYEKMNGVHLKSEVMPFAGKTLEFEYYGWIDSTLIYN